MYFSFQEKGRKGRDTKWRRKKRDFTSLSPEFFPWWWWLQVFASKSEQTCPSVNQDESTGGKKLKKQMRNVVEELKELKDRSISISKDRQERKSSPRQVTRDDTRVSLSSSTKSHRQSFLLFTDRVKKSKTKNGIESVLKREMLVHTTYTSLLLCFQVKSTLDFGKHSLKREGRDTKEVHLFLVSSPGLHPWRCSAFLVPSFLMHHLCFCGVQVKASLLLVRVNVNNFESFFFHVYTDIRCIEKWKMFLPLTPFFLSRSDFFFLLNFSSWDQEEEEDQRDCTSLT